MTLRLSTALRQRLMGEPVHTTATYSMSRTATDKINDAANAFITLGFRPGMVIYIDVFSTSAVDAYAHITSVTAAQIVVTGVTLTTEGAENGQLAAENQALRDIIAHGVLCVYSGSQPSSADVTPTGSKLLEITKGSAAFTAGNIGNSLIFDEPVAGVLGKADADTWSGVGLETGTAGWFRFYANDFDLTSNALCFDGAVGTSGAELNLSSTSIVTDATTTIDEFEITLPANA